MDPNNQPIESQPTEPIQPEVLTPPVPVTPPVEPTLTPTPPQIPVPPKTGSLLMISVIVLVISLIAGGVYFAFKYYQSTSKPINQSTISPPPSPTPIATTDPTAGWKVYKDMNNQFTFLYPPTFQIIKDLKNTPPNSIIVEIDNVDMQTSIKQQELDINQLKDVPIPERSESFKRGSFEKNYNGFIAFFPLNRSRTLVLSTNIDGSINDINLNEQFDQILSTFKFTQ